MFLLSMIVGTFATSLTGQNIELSFTGDNNGQPVFMDSVIIRNVTQGGEITLYAPDLTLTLIITGIEDRINEKDATFNLSQNYPNPFNNQTLVQLHVPETSPVKMVVSNLPGQILLTSNKVIDDGTHTFSFTPGKEKCYFLTASCEGKTQTIKMLCNPCGKGKSISLRYSEKSDFQPILKSLQLSGELPFEMGDELLMIAYSDNLESGMVKSPEMSQEYVMQFATNVACPGLDSLLYESQWYHTIQVFGQCWFKENLNAGEMINSSNPQINNDTIEKYCMGDMTSNCDIVGGLYFWDEMMQYTTQNGSQGICPEGWHVPTDLDWRILAGAADSEIPIGHFLWGVDLRPRRRRVPVELHQRGRQNQEAPRSSGHQGSCSSAGDRSKGSARCC